MTDGCSIAFSAKNKAEIFNSYFGSIFQPKSDENNLQDDITFLTNSKMSEVIIGVQDLCNCLQNLNMRNY
jgi:hypothetical protein